MLRIFLSTFLLSQVIGFAFGQSDFQISKPNFESDVSLITAAQATCPLPAPTGLIATKITPTSIRIQWNPVSNAIGYRIRVIHLGSGQLVGTHNVTTTFFTKTGLQPGQLYRFEVQSRCPNPPGGYSEQVAFMQARTGIIIVDVIIQRCCPVPTDSVIQPAGSISNYALSTSSTDYYHIRAEKFNDENTFFEFCIEDNCPELLVHIFDSSNTPIVLNTGAQMNVKYQKTATSTPDFLIIKNLVCDPTLATYSFSVTWKVKMEVFADTCHAAPFGGGSDERGFLEKENEKLQAIPNPFGDVLRILVPENGENPIEANLMDAQGRVVKTMSATGDVFEMNTQNLPNGLYFLNVRTNGNQEVIRVVKME